MSTLQERLKMIRGAKTQAAFAKEIGIPLTTLGRYERGENKPDLDFIELMAERFGISIEWLVFGKGHMHAAEGGHEQAVKAMENVQELYGQCKNLLSQLGVANDRLHQASERERMLLKENITLREEVILLQGSSK